MSRKKILLAEDVELFLELEKSFLDPDFFEVLVAYNGREAMDIALAEKPDLILMDFYMPEMNGNEACRQLKENPETADIPVVMVTQAGNGEDLKLCRAAKCDDVIVKPINQQNFLNKVRQCLNMTVPRAARIEAKIKVYFDDEYRRRLQNYSINLGPGGMFIELDTILPLDTPLTVDFDLFQGETPLTCHARVAWINDPEQPKNPRLPRGVGLQFLDMAPDTMARIRDYVQASALAGG